VLDHRAGLPTAGMAADIPGSKDPAGIRRYTGSEIIGFRAPKFDEFLLPATDNGEPRRAPSSNQNASPITFRIAGQLRIGLGT
jgi:hypothetical protein